LKPDTLLAIFNELVTPVTPPMETPKSTSKESSTVTLKSGSGGVILDSGQQEAATTPDDDPVPLKKKRNLKEVLRTRSRSLTRSLSRKKNTETNDAYELDDSQTKERRSRSRSQSVSAIHSLKQDTLLAISNEHVPPVTPPTGTASPPHSFGPPRITINEDSRYVVHDAFLVQSRGVKKLASPRKPQDEDAASRYANPERYSQRTDKPVTREWSDIHRPADVLEERHWGSLAVRRIRSHQSDARSQSQASKSTWIPTEDERYKMASAFIFGEEEFGNLSVASTSMFTDETGFPGTTDGDTRSIISESTGIDSGMFSGFSDYTEGTGVTTKTNESGYTTGSGDTSESSDTDTSYTEGTSFVSSRLTAVTDETSLFDLGLDHDKEDTPIEKHANYRKWYDLGLEDGTPIEREVIGSRKRFEYKKPKKSNNVFLEVISDLRELRTFAIATCLPCHGYKF
jgi:hypothetical protein